MKEQARAIVRDLQSVSQWTKSKPDPSGYAKAIDAAIAFIEGSIVELPGRGAKVSKAPPDPKKPSVPFLEWPEVDKREPIRITSSCKNADQFGGSNRGGYVTLSYLQPEEVDAFYALSIGNCYVAVVDGRIRTWQMYETPPTPKADPIIGPHWNKAPGNEIKVGAVPTGEGWHTPTIYVHHPQNEKAVETLESYGAICLRSRRLEEGKYWETYVLHTWRLTGRLKEHVDELEKKLGSKLSWSARAEVIARYVAKTAQSGSVDIVIQRWALTCDG